MNIHRSFIDTSYRSSTHIFEDLFDVMEKDCSVQKPIIRLEPGDRRKYTPEELEGLKHRDFKTRLFISGMSILNNCVWIRTHYTDIAELRTNLTYIRDYFKAAYSTENHVAAKAIFTSLLTTMFAMEESTYYSYATLVASGLSNQGENICFEIDDDLLPCKEHAAIARQRLILLMDILFQKMAIKKLFEGGKNYNMYRINFCAQFGLLQSLYVLFSFLLQTAMTVFVVLQVFYNCFKFGILGDNEGTESGNPKSDLIQFGQYVLASLGFIYTVLVSIPEIRSTATMCSMLYRKFCYSLLMDWIVNILFHIVLALFGFFIIIQGEDFIEAVLNTAALLFIPEIDDNLPEVLGIDQESQLENFLIREAKKEYDEYLNLSDSAVQKLFLENHVYSINFNTYFITNAVEQGRLAAGYNLFQPFVVIPNFQDGHEIDPSNLITEDCLIRKVEWKFTVFDKNDSAHPRIGYLRLDKLNGDVVNIDASGQDGIAVGELHSLDVGVYMITNFVKSSFIMQLRLCGSSTPDGFLTAMEYYSLWQLTPEAKALLQNQSLNYANTS